MMFAIHVSFSSIQIIFDNSLNVLHLKYVLFLAHLIKWGLHLKYLPVLEECFSLTLTILNTGEGTGLLRLHSTYRHDLKIYSSDEGRVQVYKSCFFS